VGTKTGLLKFNSVKLMASAEVLKDMSPSSTRDSTSVVVLVLVFMNAIDVDGAGVLRYLSLSVPGPKKESEGDGYISSEFPPLLLLLSPPNSL
jgi:hypothetical protein